MKKILIIGSVWPEPTSSAAGTHMMQLISLFPVTEYEVSFASPSVKSERAVPLTEMNIEEFPIELNSPSFNNFISELNPEIVIFDRFITEEQFGWRVIETCPNALRILNTEDLHGLRKGRELALKQKESFSKTHLHNDITKREIASIYRCDLSLIISEFELELLKNTFKIDSNILHYLPFLIEPISQESIAELPEFSERNHFITIGNFLHKPNHDAVSYVKNEVWPLIHEELPEAEMHIYGSYMPEKILQWDDPDHKFFIKGYAHDARDILSKAKICLAPVRFGAGLKGKLIDSMLAGTPCVTSTIGAEGLFGEQEPNGYISDDPEVFVRKAIELYTNEKVWNEKQENGFKIINERFRKENFQSSFLKKLESISGELQEHRSQNFIGSMLNHHTLQSTKYLSKWIEEKNK